MSSRDERPVEAPVGGVLREWLTRLRDGLRFAWAPLKAYSPDELALIDRECRETNLRRVQMVSPFTLLMQLVAHINTRRSVAHSIGEAQWRAGLLVIQSVAIPFMAFNVFVTLYPRRDAFRWYRSHVGEIAWMFYVCWGAALSANAQHFHGGFSAYMVLLLLGGSYFALPGRVLAFGTLGSLALFTAGVWRYQPVASLRASLFTTALQGIAFCTVLARVTLGSMAREITTRHALGAAKGELERLNASLEHRVEQQVGEIRAHARDVEALNAQLNAQVRERSRELSNALARLSETSSKKLDLRPGDTLEDRFTVRSVLGVGGMGAVFLGHDEVAGTEVAIKVLHPTAQNTEDHRRFLREGELLASVQHPAVVRTHHVGLTDNGRLFIVLELVRGRTLQDCVTRGTRLGAGEAARLGASLAAGLAATHAADIVHRDIKPANVMLTSSEPGVKIFDFGIARPEGPSGSDSTRTGEVLGTPAFMAPEQFEDFRAVRGQTDVYALGAVLYGAVAGRGPFLASTAGGWIRKHASSEPDDPRELVPGLDDEFTAILLRCLRKRPDERPTAKALADELAAVADRLGAPEGQAISARILERLAVEAPMVDTLAARAETGRASRLA